MKMLVLVKQVPDTATQVKVGSDTRTIDQTGITWIVSPYDEFALEEALRIKEKRGQATDEVVAVTLGPERAKEALRSCLAMGADRAIHVNDPAFEGADTLTAARALASVVKLENPQLVLTGRQAIDDDMGATGAQVAELLGWPCLSWIMEEALAEDATSIRVGRQVEGGLEVFEVRLPCVLTAQKGMNEPRYPTLKGIMGAKKKEVKEWKAADLQPAELGAVAPALEVVALEALPPRPPGRILTGDPKDMARELVRTLREDVKAIKLRRPRWQVRSGVWSRTTGKDNRRRSPPS